MAKDDYHVVAFKILTYLYAVFKRKISFDERTFKLAIGFDQLEEGYLYNVLEMMHSEELIKGIGFISAWGGTLVLVTSLENMKITAKGISYLNENSTMQKVKKILLDNVSYISDLIKLLV